MITALLGVKIMSIQRLLWDMGRYLIIHILQMRRLFIILDNLSIDFYAIADIKNGEEITINYNGTLKINLHYGLM